MHSKRPEALHHNEHATAGACDCGVQAVQSTPRAVSEALWMFACPMACLQQRTVKVICIDICMAPPSPPWRSPLKVPAWPGAQVVSKVTAKSPATASATLPTLPGRAGLSSVRRRSRGFRTTA